VIFRQVDEPGRRGLSAFTDTADLSVTIAAQPLDHRLDHFRSVWSGFDHAHRRRELCRAYGRAAERTLAPGRDPGEHRSDKSFGRLPQSRCRRSHRSDPALRSALRTLWHGTESQQPRVTHENGAIESAHDYLKQAIRDALLMRGTAAFGPTFPLLRFR
jgi:hypothetical protein